MVLEPPKIDPNSTLPYGTDPPKSRTPLLFWSVLYGAWIVFLVVMAFFYSNR